MAAVTGPGNDVPRRADRRWSRRKVWAAVAVAVWIVVVAGLGAWSVGHERATVPEQRNIGQAVPELQAAVGATVLAAGGAGRAVVLQDLQFDRDCPITPVRSGVVATRDVTVYAPEGEAGRALDAVADRLPKRFQAYVADSRGGTAFTLHADAGNFIGIDSSADAGSKVLTLRVSSGCRPLGGSPDVGGPPAGQPPAALDAVLRALGTTGEPATVEAVACPNNAVAGTWTVNGIAAAADFRQRLTRWGAGAETVRADDSVLAYRAGADSVVVVPDGKRLRLSVTSPC